MASGDTKTESYLRAAAEGTRADLPADSCCNTKTQNLILGVANRIMDVEDEVERLENNPDVADIVSTYADLQNYDTSTLTDKDVIRVLQDETHDGDSTYYRYSTSTGEFTYVGESKQYTDFVGTDGANAGESGLVPAPTAADADKFLKSDGTWDTVGGGSTVNVVQTAGTSTTDVMSQKATTSMIFNDPSDKTQIVIGAVTSVSQPTELVVIGRSAKGRGESVSIGSGAGSTDAQRNYNVNLGSRAICGSNYSVALGYYAKTTRNGEVNVGSGNNPYGYNSTSYRVIGGVHDGVDAHDVMTVGQANALIDAINTALSTNIPHIGA